MIVEAMTNIKAVLYERLSNPWIGSFILSWCLWNYKFILLITSSIPPTNKFFIIDNYIYHDYLSYFTNGLIYPIITSTAIIFIYPYPTKIIYSFWLKKQKELLELKQNIEGTTLISEEKSRKLRKEIAEFQMLSEKEIEEKNEKIETLKSLLADKDKIISDQNKIISENINTNNNISLDSDTNLTNNKEFQLLNSKKNYEKNEIQDKSQQDYIDELLGLDSTKNMDITNDSLSSKELQILKLFKLLDKVFVPESELRSIELSNIEKNIIVNSLIAKKLLKHSASSSGIPGYELTHNGQILVLNIK